MNGETIKIKEIEEKYIYHTKEAEKWGMILKSLKELNKSTRIAHSKVFEDCRMKKSIQICVNLLKNNGVIKSSGIFLEEVKKNGIEISQNSLSAILSQSYKYVKPDEEYMSFNKKQRQWELKRRDSELSPEV